MFQSNAKLKLVRSLAVCEESSGPFSSDGLPESVRFIHMLSYTICSCSITYNAVFHAISQLNVLTGWTVWFLSADPISFSRISFSCTSAVRPTRKRRSPPRRSMKTKRRIKRTKRHAKCCPAVRLRSYAFYAFCFLWRVMVSCIIWPSIAKKTKQSGMAKYLIVIESH